MLVKRLLGIKDERNRGGKVLRLHHYPQLARLLLFKRQRQHLVVHQPGGGTVVQLGKFCQHTRWPLIGLPVGQPDIDKIAAGHHKPGLPPSIADRYGGNKGAGPAEKTLDGGCTGQPLLQLLERGARQRGIQRIPALLIGQLMNGFIELQVAALLGIRGGGSEARQQQHPHSNDHYSNTHIWRDSSKKSS